MTADDSAGLVVRAARSADLTALGRLGALLVQEHHDFDARRFIAARSGTPQGYASFLGSQLDQPDVVVLVAESDGQVIGYVYGAIEGYDYMSLRGPAAVLHDLIVDPDHRGRGVGRMLLNTGAVAASITWSAPCRAVHSRAERIGAETLRTNGLSPDDAIEMTRELDGTDDG